MGPLHNPKGDPFTLRSFLKGKKGFGSNPDPHPNNPVMKGLSTILKEGGSQTNPFQALRGQIEVSTLKELDVEVEGGATTDFEKEGKKAVVTESSQLSLETSRLEAHLVDPDLLNRFEISTPIVINSSSLTILGQPIFQGGSSSLGGLHVLGDKEEDVLPLAIVVENEVEGGTGQEGPMVGFGQEEGIVEATPLVVEGYESWEVGCW